MWRLTAGQAPHCCVVPRDSENFTGNSSLVFPPENLLWAFAISLASPLNRPEPACFHDYVFKWKHVFDSGIKRPQLEVSAAFLFICLHSGSGCEPSPVGWCGPRRSSSGTEQEIGPAHQSVHGPPATAGGFVHFPGSLRTKRILTIWSSDCIGKKCNS